jgi:hypothetical protein
VLKTSWYLESHVKLIHQGIKELTCDKCGKTFGNRTCLENHCHRVHEDKPFKCDQCITSWATESLLKIHVSMVHVRDVKYHCDRCEFFSYKKRGLKYHIMTKHEQDTSTKYYCDLCDKFVTLAKDRLAVHVRMVHQKETRFQCDYCAKKFFRNSDKNAHIKRSHASSTK